MKIKSKIFSVTVLIFLTFLFLGVSNNVHAAGTWGSASIQTINGIGDCQYENTCSDVSGAMDPSSSGSSGWNRTGYGCPTPDSTVICYENILDFGMCTPPMGRSDSTRTKFTYMCNAVPEFPFNPTCSSGSATTIQSGVTGTIGINLGKNLTSYPYTPTPGWGGTGFTSKVLPVTLSIPKIVQGSDISGTDIKATLFDIFSFINPFNSWSSSPYISNLSIKSKPSAVAGTYTAQASVVTQPVTGGSCTWSIEANSCGIGQTREIIDCASSVLSFNHTYGCVIPTSIAPPNSANVTTFAEKICGSGNYTYTALGNPVGSTNTITCITPKTVTNSCNIPITVTDPPPNVISGAPSNVAATLGTCAVGATIKPVNISWTAPNNTNYVGFNIYRSGTTLPIASSVLSDGTTYVDTPPTVDTSYTYSVTAAYVGGESTLTSATPITAQACPSSPTSCPSGTPFVASKTLGTIRNNYSGWVGAKFTVGASPLSVTALGRIRVSDNSQSHRVKLVRASDGSDVTNGLVSIDMSSGTANEYKYASLPGLSPVTLSANTDYYILSEELNGGDKWYDWNTSTIPTTQLGTINGGVYGNVAPWSSITASNRMYVPVDFCSSVALPNLVASYPYPTNAIDGISQLYFSKISNIGNAPTPDLASINHLFRYDNDANHNSVTASFVVPTTNIFDAKNGYTTISNSYAFSNVDKGYIQVCADSDTSLAGKVTESNETDNCNNGNWTEVNVAANTPGLDMWIKNPLNDTDKLPTITIKSGQKATIQWNKVGSLTNVTGCVAKLNNVSVSSASPYITANLSSGTYAYTLKCVDSNNPDTNTNTVTATAPNNSTSLIINVRSSSIKEI